MKQNTLIKYEYEYLKIALKYVTWVNVLSYSPPRFTTVSDITFKEKCFGFSKLYIKTK